MGNLVNILLIEDNPGDIRLVQERLRESTDFHANLFIADNVQRGLRYIATERIDVILLDLNLPDSADIKTFKQVNKFAMHVPVIIMSILSDNELIYEAMKQGAKDYLIKERIENESLLRAIRYSIWSFHAA